jgi:glutaredoxin
MIKAYVQTYCPFCQRAVAFLKESQLPHEIINLDTDNEKLQSLKQKYNHPTIPIIVMNEKLIGGFDELWKLHQSGELERQLNS